MTTVNEINTTARAFQESRILLTAWELGIFTALGESALESGEVADACGADPRAVDRLMNALVVLGLLHKEQKRFRNTEAALTYLVQSSPHYLAGLGHTSDLYEYWGSLTEAVKAGRSVYDKNDAAPWLKEQRRENFIAAMHARGRAQAGPLIELLNLQGDEQVLDVGGGSGIFSAAMCRAHASVSCTVLDTPEVTELTKRYASEQGVADRISFLPGDYHTTEFGTGFDLVFLSAIVHINSPQENMDLFKKSSACLHSGGRIAVNDFIMEDDRVQPPFGAIFALNMLVNTQKGDTYTKKEVAQWLEEAGFTAIEFTQSGPMTTLVTARKK